MSAAVQQCSTSKLDGRCNRVIDPLGGRYGGVRDLMGTSCLNYLMCGARAYANVEHFP